MARRSGSLAVGTQAVRKALRSDLAELVVTAADHSSRTEDKVIRLAEARGVRTVVGPNARDLGRLLGRVSLQAVAVMEPNVASGILAKLASARRS